MTKEISDAIVIVESGAAKRPACVTERSGTPVLIHLLRHLAQLGVDHVMLSASHSHERSIRPMVAGYGELPVCEMVPGPREGPDSSAAAFFRCRREQNSRPTIVTRASILPERDTWLEQMLANSGSSAAVVGAVTSSPAWFEGIGVRGGKLAARTRDELDDGEDPLFLLGTYVLRAPQSNALFRSISTSEESQRRALSLESAVLALVEDGIALEAVRAEKPAWLWAETVSTS